MFKMRRVALALALLVALGTAAAWMYYEALKRAWIRYNEYDIRTEGTLQVGDLAPDLELRNVHGEAQMLSDLHRDKPLVLVFGSYT